jgi:hypothetical protein
VTKNKEKDHDHNHSQQQKALEEDDCYDIMTSISFQQHGMIKTQNRAGHLLESTHCTHIYMPQCFSTFKGLGGWNFWTLMIVDC